MANLSAYTTQRNTAGSRYAAAVTELLSALVDLAALDICISNIKLGGPQVVSDFSANAKDAWQDLPVILEHKTFNLRVPRRLADEIRAQADVYIAAIT